MNYFIIFFFFGSLPKKSSEVAGVGRPEAVDGGWQQQLVVAGPNISRLETCIRLIKWANILGLKPIDH
jgi:hypothetical protein